MDKHYTPRALAELMISALPVAPEPGWMADFSAGTGQLLLPALERWPSAKAIGNDLCKSSCRKLRLMSGINLTTNVDFFSDEAISRSSLAPFAGKIDLVLANPPFSERFKLDSEAALKIEGVRVGRALYFVNQALKFLAPTGTMLAVVPDGCLSSQRDSKGWAHIKQKYEVVIISENSAASFVGVRAKTSLLLIRRKSVPTDGPLKVASVTNVLGKPGPIIRGQYQMHWWEKPKGTAKLRLIHTSDLLSGIVCRGKPLDVAAPTVMGPALLMPRVGKTDRGKLAILESGREIVISDCVIAVTTKSMRSAKQLQKSILRNWDQFERIYRGTGAPYVTLARLDKFLAQLD